MQYPVTDVSLIICLPEADRSNQRFHLIAPSPSSTSRLHPPPPASTRLHPPPPFDSGGIRWRSNVGVRETIQKTGNIVTIITNTKHGIRSLINRFVLIPLPIVVISLSVDLIHRYLPNDNPPLSIDTPPFPIHQSILNATHGSTINQH